ncbi:hypothetical protein SELMODRAFT_424167 [Selaginella moellendorffii]|uniref:Neprosin PEP catalytic domain-containing protein n=1 Tax=Selaginella moellendorffii TaxID=88036 RepID=D8SP15_SELML|nr:uncharacterized protein LOC9649098 [Selaginella moellendorffii]EFJ13893.1 hypothetical protein SELMODRAFT_424167 [Selaginella moellendorffii]|eukprot:XP_002985018.1 uncharacterized protein LOC9649098 [Selaginella moellendorffii]
MSETEALLLMVCFLLAYAAADLNEEMRDFLRDVNPPFVTNHTLSNGDIILCVPIKNQLSLRNQTLQLLPPQMMSKQEHNRSENSGQLFGLEVGSCKENTIPVLHTSNTIAARFDSVRKLTKKHSSGKNRVPLADEEPGVETHEHGYNQLNGNFRGMETTINVWEPYVEKTSEFSLAQLWIISKKLGPLNTIEAGWQIYPKFYGGTGPRLFVYWTADGYDKTGCYNLQCQGFVQTSNKYVLGGSFSSVSTPDSTQYEKTLCVFQDDSSKNWWLQIDGESIGYWPASLFQSLQNGAETLEAGGEVCYDKESGVRHTKTGMGSGEFPSQGYLKAAYQRRIQYLDSNGVMQPAIGMKSGAEVPKCYTATSVAADKGDNWGAYFFFGGPGYSNQCP